MARSTRTNYAKCKIWTERMTSEIEGTIAGVALMTFQSVAGKAAREEVLKHMQAHHVAACEREAEAPK